MGGWVKTKRENVNENKKSFLGGCCDVGGWLARTHASQTDMKFQAHYFGVCGSAAATLLLLLFVVGGLEAPTRFSQDLFSFKPLRKFGGFERNLFLSLSLITRLQIANCC